ncbi:MAG TPA: diacylglycerol kinase family protein [Clostridia bacterium]|nr:diacylglycerol kinase family protein [Clostridia bacterium]
MGPRRFFASLRYAAEGIAYCIKTQRNMRIHLVVAIIVLLSGILLKVVKTEFIMVLISISMVFICEIINTAVERAVDTATLEYHPIAKIAKDVAAGAVLVAALNSVIVGLLVFGKYLSAIVLKLLE